jgi:hypothetical protein
VTTSGWLNRLAPIGAKLSSLKRCNLPHHQLHQQSSANLHRRHLNAGQRAVVALKVRELLQPAAKERIAEAGRSAAPGRPAEKASADLREAIQPQAVQPAPPPPTSAEQRKSTAQAAKAVGASPRAVEQAARVAKVAPDLLPQVQAGTLALDRAHREGGGKSQERLVKGQIHCANWLSRWGGGNPYQPLPTLWSRGW